MVRKYQVSIQKQMKGFVFIGENATLPNYQIGTILFINFAYNDENVKSPDYKTDLYKMPIEDETIINDLITKLGYDSSECSIRSL